MAEQDSLTSKRARKAAYMREYSKRRYIHKRDEINSYVREWARRNRKVGPWGGLKLLEIRQLAEAAFHLEAWQSRPLESGDSWPTVDQFFEGVAKNFEALLADTAERLGAGFRSQGFGAGVMQAYRSLPPGWSAFDLLEERQAQARAERVDAMKAAKAERAKPRKSGRGAVRHVDAATAGPVAVKRDPLFSLFGGVAP
jgi:hypothetical protein